MLKYCYSIKYKTRQRSRAPKRAKFFKNNFLCWKIEGRMFFGIDSNITIFWGINKDCFRANAEAEFKAYPAAVACCHQQPGGLKNPEVLDHLYTVKTPVANVVLLVVTSLFDFNLEFMTIKKATCAA